MAVRYSSYSMLKRLLALTMLIAFFSVCVIFRLFYLQVSGSYSIVKKGMTEWLRDLPLIANRGSITDRNGVVLASSYTTYDVYVRPADVIDPAAVSKVLSEKLELDFAKIYENISKHSYSEIKIKQNIEKQKVQEILKEYQKGIFFTTNSNRSYAYDEMLCQILGFVSGDGVGQTGIEAFYDSYLKGINGVSLVQSDLKGTTLDGSVGYYEDAIAGLNLSLTIDFQIQTAVEQILQTAMTSTGAKSISCLVSNPQTGEILSVCSLPSYNLNDIPRDDISALNTLSRATTIVDTFEPGSTFKAIVTAIALQEGVTTKHSYFYCSGYRIINGVRIRCSRRSGHGSQSLTQGLMNSCNCVFMDLIEKIGVKKFYDYLNKFGFTSRLGIDFPGEVTVVLMPMPSVTAPDLARMGFGQTIALSALEMVSGLSTVINGGYVLEPHFIKTISSSSAGVIYSREKTIKDKILSEETSKIMREMLFEVVNSGGGKNAKVDGYPIIGGKTGTAQKYENGAIANGKYIASFIGFAPHDSPEYVVYVVVDEPQGAYYGGVVAAPIASQIFENIFKIKNVSESEIVELEQMFKLSTFIGSTITEAASKAAGLGLQYLVQGDGDYVTGQVPAPGTNVKKGDIVLLMFEWGFMKLYTILKNINCRVFGNTVLEIKGLYHKDSEVKEGGLFFCLRGTRVDGKEFVMGAIKNGAVAIVSEQEIPNLVGVTQIVVKNARETMSLIACKFYGNPASKLNIIGVTGTNGKTTTTHIISSVLESVGFKTAIVGTNGVVIKGVKYDSGMTTPDPIDLQKYFALMVKNKIDYVCMEVSAHAIGLHKVDGVVFEQVVFTNLTQDHLDFFKTMQNYFETKKKLFSKRYAKMAVLNVDDAWGQKLCESINLPICTYAINNAANFVAENIVFNGTGQCFMLNKKLQICMKLIGKFNVYNALSAICVLKNIGLSDFEITKGLSEMQAVQGRFNFCNVQGKLVVIDYAHTPDGLQNVLCACREIAGIQKVISVFGCGGNRDVGKRKLMGKISSSLADFTVITSDNPRFENCEDIVKDIESGVQNKNYMIELDRAVAIKKAIDLADNGDVVLVAGKGAEDYIEENGKKLPYSDMAEIEKIRRLLWAILLWFCSA